MFVKDVMSKNIVSVRPDEHVSQALAKMEKNKVHQLPVMSNSTLYGMLELKKIVTRDIDISSAKSENFATNVPQIDSNATVESAAQLLLASAVRAMPVMDGGAVVGIISESDLMRVAKQYVRGLNQKVNSIISPAEYIDKDGVYGNVKRLILDRNISRVPIVDGEKVIGIVSTFEMIKVLRGKETMEVRGNTQEKATKEKMRLEETPVTAILRQVTVVSDIKTINDVVDLLKTNEEVVVKYDGGFGIVTPRDILELFKSISPKKEVYVQITGMQDESIEFKVKMDLNVTEFVNKIAKVVKHVEYFVVHVDKMHKQGNRNKYSIRVRFKASEGFFVAHAWGWKPLDVIQEVFRNLEREILHKYGKIQTDRKKRRFASKIR